MREWTLERKASIREEVQHRFPGVEIECVWSGVRDGDGESASAWRVVNAQKSARPVELRHVLILCAVCSSDFVAAQELCPGGRSETTTVTCGELADALQTREDALAGVRACQRALDQQSGVLKSRTEEFERCEARPQPRQEYRLPRWVWPTVAASGLVSGGVAGYCVGQCPDYITGGAVASVVGVMIVGVGLLFLD